MRFPFLLANRCIAPFDYTGLRQSPARLIRHVIGTHHEGKQPVYDFQILDAYGALDRLYYETQAIVGGTHPKHEWFKDLCVYENYHHKLLCRIKAWQAGEDQLTDADHKNPDLTFTGLLSWCVEQPESPMETYRAWRSGKFRFETNV